jgi:hypothetical protein
MVRLCSGSSVKVTVHILLIFKFRLTGHTSDIRQSLCVIGCELDDQGNVVRLPTGVRYSSPKRPYRLSAHPVLINVYTGSLPSRIRRLGREADNSPLQVYRN